MSITRNNSNVVSVSVSGSRKEHDDEENVPSSSADETDHEASHHRRPTARLVGLLRHLVPTKETLAKDLAMVGYGMAFSPPPVAM